MLGILIFTGAALAIYAITQGFTGTQADAPGHCCGQTGECGMKLSYAELVTLAQNAGFDDPNVAAAIALAESGGDPSAYNPETQACTPEGEGSYGLWQIYKKAHPEFSCMDLTVPEENANAAFSVYTAAGGFHPWSTYKNGVYTKYLQ